MKIKALFLIALSLFTCAASYSAVWRVNNIAGVDADFATAQAAHDAAAAGDTIMFEPSGTNYGALTLTKPLILIGPGNFLGENPETQANKMAGMVSNTIFNSGSSGSIAMGIYFVGYININTTNIVLKRNRIYYNSTTAVTVAASNCVIIQNYIKPAYEALKISSGVTGTIVSNNYINSTSTSYFAINMVDNTTSATFTNNVVENKTQLYNADFKNNILINSLISGTSNTFLNNIEDGAYLPVGNGNLSSILMTDVFIDPTGASSDGMYTLSATSPALAAGYTGEDCGIFGGVDPYVLSGMPEVPAIYFYSAPSTGTQSSGLPVHIKAKSHKAVGL